MKELSKNEIAQVSGSIHLHFNPFQLVGGIVIGFAAGGPFGVGVAIATAIVAQGSGNLYEMAVDEWGNPR